MTDHESLDVLEAIHSTPARRFLKPDPIPDDVLMPNSVWVLCTNMDTVFHMTIRLQRSGTPWLLNRSMLLPSIGCLRYPLKDTVFNGSLRLT